MCRFYENQYPQIEEVVMVNVRTIAEMGAYVTLLEYDNIEGMILLSGTTRHTSSLDSLALDPIARANSIHSHHRDHHSHPSTHMSHHPTTPRSQSSRAGASGQ